MKNGCTTKRLDDAARWSAPPRSGWAARARSTGSASARAAAGACRVAGSSGRLPASIGPVAGPSAAGLPRLPARRRRRRGTRRLPPPVRLPSRSGDPDPCASRSALLCSSFIIDMSLSPPPGLAPAACTAAPVTGGRARGVGRDVPDRLDNHQIGNAAAHPPPTAAYGAAGRTGTAAERPERRPPAAWLAPSAAAAGRLVMPGCSNVAGIGRIRHWLGGQTIRNARPITSFSGIMPLPGSASWPARVVGDARGGRRAPTGTRPGP